MAPAFSGFLTDKKKMRNRRSPKTNPRLKKTSLLSHLKLCPASCAHLWVALLSFAVTFFPVQVHALPSGGTVQGGTASIQSGGSGSLNINQQSERAIIDWIHFNIQSGEHVNFDMPSADSVNLSRVTGGNASEIFGKLTSNGQLFLVNPNGILFGQGSQVDVNGLVATTSDISNQDFMAGRYNFNIASPFSSSVVNRGTITVKQGGLAAFVAPGVENSGIINAQLGRVSLHSGKTFTLDLYGDQLVNLGLDSEVTDQVLGPDGQPLSSLVTNSGEIFADGGRVTLGVNAARDLVDHAINMSGLIQAQSIAEKNGEIYLMGGETGTVNVTGTLDASGYGEDETGGVIHVLGDRVFLDDYGFIDISGDAGGGTLLFGGDYQGNGTVQNATDTYVGSDASIWADAMNTGNGGRAIFWADRRNYFLGRVRARGGALSGDGGFVEVSGKESLFFNGYVDTTALNGETGTLLLDPDNITIKSGILGQPGDTSLPDIAASGGISFTVSELALESQSATTNINLLAEDNIFIEDLTTDNRISFRQTAGNRVSLIAKNGNIQFQDVNDEISTQGGDIILKAGGDMMLGQINAGAGTVSIFGKENGTISLGTNNTGDLHLKDAELSAITAGNLVIGGASFGEGRAREIIVEDVNAFFNTDNVTLQAFGPKTQSGILFTEGRVTFNGTLSSFTHSNGAKNTSLNVQSLSGIQVNSNITSSGDMILDANSDDFFNLGPDTLSLGAGVVLDSTRGALNLRATTGGIIGAGALTLNGDNGIVLDDSITTGGDLTFNDNVGLTGSANFINAGANKIIFQNNANRLEAGNGNNGLTLNSDLDFTGAGPFTINADVDGNGTGSFFLSGGKTINTMGQALDITASNLMLDGSLNSGGASTTIRSTNANGVDLALANNPGRFRLDDTELGRITADSLSVDATVGTLTANGVDRTTHLANIANGVSMSGNTVVFEGADSSFNSITVNGIANIKDGVDLSTAAGSMTFSNALTVDANASPVILGTTGGNIFFNNSLNGGADVQVNSGAGTSTFGGSVGNTTALSSLTVTGNTTLNGSALNTSNGNVTFNNNVTLGNTVNINTGAGGGNVNFSGTIEGAAPGDQGLTVSTGTGTSTFQGNVGSTTSLSSVIVSGNSTINGDVTVQNGPVSFNNNLTLGGNSTISSGVGGINLNAVDGSQALVLNSGGGGINLDGNVGFNTALTSLNVTGASTISGASINTANGDVTFNSGVTLDTGAVNINTGIGGGNIQIGAIDGAQDLALNSGTGTISLNGSVGGTTTLNSLSATGTTTIAGSTLATNNGITFNGNVTANSVLDLNADADNTGVGTFDQQAGTLNTNGNALSITARDINLAGGTNSGAEITTIIASQNQGMSLGDANEVGDFRLSNPELGNFATTGGFVFGNGTGRITVNNVNNTLSNTINGSSVVFNGGSSSFGTLAVTGPTTIAGVNVTTNNAALTFNNNVSLTTGPVQLSTGAGGGDLTLGGNVDGGQNLTLTSGTGNVIFGGSVGATTRLNSLTVNGTTTFSGASLLTNNGITFNGMVTANNASGFSLNADADNAGGGTFTQQSGSLSTGGNALSITAQDFNLTGTLNSGGGTTTLIASQNQDMSLGDATGGLRLDNTELGQIMAGGFVFGNGTAGITINNVTNNAGTTLNGTTLTFNGVNSSFGSLIANGTTTIDGGVDIATTAGSLTFNNAVTANANGNQVLLSANGGNIALNSTLDGGANVQVNSGAGTTTFGGNIGSTTELDQLTVTGTSQMNGDTIRTNNGVTVSGNLTGNGNLTVNSDVDADGTGTFNQTAGVITNTNGDLNLTAADVTLNGTAVNVGTGTMTIIDSQSGTIGLGAANCGGACGLTLDGGELDKIVAWQLETGTDTGGAVFVDGVTGAQSADIQLMDIKSGGLATFDNQSELRNLILDVGDLAINDQLSVGNGLLGILTSDGGNLGVGTAVGDMTLDTAELALLRAGYLSLFTTGNITLGNVTIDSANITQIFEVFGKGLNLQGPLVSPIDTRLLSFGTGQGISLNDAGNFFGGTLNLFTGSGGDVSISNLFNNGQTVRLGDSNIGGGFSLTTPQAIQFVGGVDANDTVVVSSTSSGIGFDDGAFLNAGMGTLRLNSAGNLTLGQLVSGSSSLHAIHLEVGGAVIDGGDMGGEDIIAANGGLFARTTNGFGTEDNPIETRIHTLDLTNSTNGDISFFETDSLHLANLTQGSNGDIFGSYNGMLSGADNIEIIIGRFFIKDRASGLTLSQELGDTGKDRDALSIERTINNIVDLDFASGSNRFDWDPADGSPAGKIKDSSAPGGEALGDPFGEPFPLVEVKEGNPEDGDLAHLENVWHWNDFNVENVKETDSREKKKAVKKKRAKKEKKTASKQRKRRQEKKDSGILSFFKKAGSILSFK